MKKWTRWQDWTVVAAGAYAALSVLWTTTIRPSTEEYRHHHMTTAH